MSVDLVFHSGVIWGHGGPQEAAEGALAVSEGKIVAIGPQAAALASSAGEVVDLAGGALLPSFGDGHAHPMQGGLAARYADVNEKASVEEVLQNVAAWAEAHPDAPWVRGLGYTPELAPGANFDATWLDSVVPDRPVWLQASDYHTAWVNTRALELAGITADTPDPDDGEIVRRADGTPMGTLREWGAWRKIEALAPEDTLETKRDALLDAARHLAALGITWVQDAWVEGDVADAWLAAAATGHLAVRANLALLAAPNTWHEDLDRMVATRRRVADEGGGLVTAHAVKLFADGIIEGGTGALLEPYVDCPHSHGMPNWDWAELAEAVTAVDALGFQPHIHAIGDAAVRGALDAIEEAVRRNGPRDRRAVVAHTQLVDPADLPRFAALGVIANFEPLWAQANGTMTDLTEPRLGPVRSGFQYPIATLGRLGPISFGSDWPVSSADPREGLAVAVSHLRVDAPDVSASDEPWLPGERITVEEAVDAYTRGVAYQAFGESEWGTLRVGNRADLVLLDRDPRVVGPLDLPSVRVAGTWLGGRRTF
jgi:hypothetical protein